MRRIIPLLAVAACPLVALLAACDGGSAAPPASATVAVGTLPGSLPGETAPATSAPATEPSDPTEPSEPSSSARATTTTVAPTRFADLLADLVGGEPVGPPPSDVVVDDTRRLRMELPTAWSDRRTTPAPLAEGVDAPYVAAAPDQRRFFDGYGQAGLTAVVVDAAPADALDAYRFDDCTDDGRSRFTTADLTGMYQVWRDCGETRSSIVTVAARQGRVPGTVLVLAQIVDRTDLAALDQALATTRLAGR
jgi:hypothetical protein